MSSVLVKFTQSIGALSLVARRTAALEVTHCSCVHHLSLGRIYFLGHVGQDADMASSSVVPSLDNREDGKYQ